MYRIIQTNDQFHIVYAINGGKTVVRTLNSFASLSDAERLLRDLAA